MCVCIFISNVYIYACMCVDIIVHVGSFVCSGDSHSRTCISNQKQLSCKKGAAPKKAMVKKDVKSKVMAKKWL